MKIVMLHSALALAALPLGLATLDGGEWPGWRGPGGNAVAPGSPPLEWNAEHNVKWKTEIPGKGLSSPVVWGSRVFVSSAIQSGEPAAEPEGRAGGRGGFGGARTPPAEHAFLVFALDRSTGELLWEQNAAVLTPHQGAHSDGSFASQTLVTDGQVVIASFGSFGVYAYDVEGEPLWEKDLGDMIIARSFGEGSSPVLHGDLVVINWDHTGESFIVALDRMTGEERWRTEREALTTWGTPMIVEVGETTQVVVAGARTQAYDLATGAEVWSLGAPSAPSAPSADSGERRQPRGRGEGGGSSTGVAASPVLHEGILLFSTGSQRGAFRAVRVAEAEGELDEVEDLLWASPGDTPFIPSPIAYDGILYSLKSNSALLSAYDVQSGERIYGPQRMQGLGDSYASPVAADGRLYFVGRDGMAEVVSAGPEFETLAVNDLGEPIDASPAIAGDELFLRGRTHLYCIAAD